MAERYFYCDQCPAPLQPTLWATGYVYICVECDRYLVSPDAPTAKVVVR